MGRPMSGTLSNRPISSGVNVRRPVTAIDFGETPIKLTSPGNISLRSKATAQSADEEFFADHNEASVCLVVESDESEDDADVKENASEETLRDMVLTANEYFSRSAVEGANWWE